MRGVSRLPLEFLKDSSRQRQGSELRLWWLSRGRNARIKARSKQGYQAVNRKPEPHAIEAAIGRVIRVSVYVEHALRGIVHALIEDFQRYTRIVTAELPFSRLPALILSLYRERNGEDEHFIELESLLKRATSAQSKRDLLVHSEWLASASSVTAIRLKTTAKQKTGYKTTVENWDLEMFAELTNDFTSVLSDVARLIQDLQSEGKAFNMPVYEQNQQ